MNGPVWNRPSRSDRMRRSVFRSDLDWTTTVAPATGRPVGLSTVPERARPAFITTAVSNARRALAVTDCFRPTWSEWVVTSSSRTSGLAEAGRASDRHRPWASVIAAATSLSGPGYRSRPPPGGATPTCKSTRPRDRPALVVAHGAADRHPALQGHGIGLGDRTVPVPSKLDGCESGVDDDDLEERGRAGRERDRVAPLLVGRALRECRSDPGRHGPRPTRRPSANDRCASTTSSLRMRSALGGCGSGCGRVGGWASGAGTATAASSGGPAESRPRPSRPAPSTTEARQTVTARFLAVEHDQAPRHVTGQGGGRGRDRPGRRRADGRFRQRIGDRRPGALGQDRGHRHRRDPATDQPGPQPRPAAGQAALERPHRAGEPPGGLGVRPALQVAEHHRVAIPRRQPGDLLVDDVQHVVPLGPGYGSHGRFLRHRGRTGRILMRTPTERLGPRPHRHPPGNAVQPGAQPPGVADRPGPLHQHQERRLERILDVVPVAEDPPADAQHHRAVQGHQRGERRLVATRREPLEQLAVVQPRHRPAVEELPDRRQHRNLPARHVGASAPATSADRFPLH